MVEDICVSIWEEKKPQPGSFLWTGRSLLGRTYLTGCGGQAWRHSPALLCAGSTAGLGKRCHSRPVCRKGGNRLLASEKQAMPTPLQHLPVFMFAYRKITPNTWKQSRKTRCSSWQLSARLLPSACGAMGAGRGSPAAPGRWAAENRQKGMLQEENHNNKGTASAASQPAGTPLPAAEKGGSRYPAGMRETTQLSPPTASPASKLRVCVCPGAESTRGLPGATRLPGDARKHRAPRARGRTHRRNPPGRRGGDTAPHGMGTHVRRL